MWKSWKRRSRHTHNEIETNEINSLEELPDEILTKIFGFLDPKSLCRICTVSKRFSEVGSDSALWASLCTHYFKWTSMSLRSMKDLNDSTDYKTLFKNDFFLGPHQELENRRKRRKWLREQQYGTFDMKVSFLGDRFTGKTSLICRTTSEQFVEYYISDEAEAYYSLHLMVDGKTVFYHLCDSPGNPEYFDGVRKTSFKDVDAIVLCVSLVDPTSLQHAKNFWLPLIRLACYDIPVILVGCKVDQRDDFDNGTADPSITAVVTYEELEEFAELIGAKDFLECSAKSGEGANEVFEETARVLLKQEPEEEATERVTTSGSSRDNCVIQ